MDETAATINYFDTYVNLYIMYLFNIIFIS